MNRETAQTLNWQLSQKLGLNPSIPHIINANSECDCISSYTRDDAFYIWVESKDGDTVRVNESWLYLTDFISSLVEQGKPDSLEGVAAATISSSANQSYDEDCHIMDGIDTS